MDLIDKLKIIINAKVFLKILIKERINLCVIESCTGGYLSSILTSFSGSSKVLDFGLVTYSNESKNKIAKISKIKLRKYGSVSKEISLEMAKNILKFSKKKNSMSISCTGIAGPSGGTKQKPVGTVIVTIYYKKKSFTFHKKFFNLKRSSFILKTVNFMILEGTKIIKNVHQ